MGLDGLHRDKRKWEERKAFIASSTIYFTILIFLITGVVLCGAGNVWWANSVGVALIALACIIIIFALIFFVVCSKKIRSLDRRISSF